jgi:dihydroorotate dehydrogenase (NAD+) catalytic subunit
MAGVDISIDIAGIKMKNPVMVASGTFGWGKEYSEVMDLSKLGAIVTKTITLKPREGNPPPRICETPSGMLNSIGLQNEGVDALISEQLPFLEKFKVPIIVNIAEESTNGFAEIAMKLDKIPLIKGLELNISCPNVNEGGMLFGVDPKLTADVVRKVKRTTALPVIAKLTPNVTNIVEIAKAAEGAGADALSLINTVVGMAIDIENRKPKIGAGFGGLSGPAIRPIAVRMVHQVSKAVKIPVIGIGGIMTGEDAVEFLLAGASAVQVGTANFVDMEASIKVAEGIKSYLEAHKLSSIKDIIGKVRI